MSTAALCGYGGTITGAGGTEIKSWEVSQTVDVQEATSMDSAGWKERIPCLTGANGTFVTVGTSSTVGVHAGCAFKDKASGGGYTISGDIIINSITIGTPVDGLVSFNHAFVFTGAVTAA